MEDFGFNMLTEFQENYDGRDDCYNKSGKSEIPREWGYSRSGKSKKTRQNGWYRKSTAKSDFFNAALRVLYTLTPAILILDSQRRVVFANREAEELLERGDVISQDRKGKIFCTDHIAQNFLLRYVTSHKSMDRSVFNDEDGSFLIPKTDGWPMVAMVGCDQLDALNFSEGGFDIDGHITLMIRDPNGRNPEQSKKLMEYFGLSGAESTVVGELVKGNSTDEIARKRGVSVVTIRNQLKSAQNKMGVARQSELVSLVLRYIS